MRFHFAWAAALFFALIAQPLLAADWSVEIVPQLLEGGSPSISLKSPFHVILTNRTDHDLTVWKEWCGDGYFNLSFKFTGKDGNVINVQKQSRDWAKNFPDPFVVAPGKHFVLAVTLTAEIWQGTESLDGLMTMQAIYENTSSDDPFGDPNSLIKPAWLGKVASNPISVTIWR